MEALGIVLTLQQIVLSKNWSLASPGLPIVLTLQQIVLSKNLCEALGARRKSFDFTTNCSF